MSFLSVAMFLMYFHLDLVTLKEDPVITGASGNVQLGEDVLLNCSTKPAMPTANIVWYVDGRPEKVLCNSRLKYTRHIRHCAML